MPIEPSCFALPQDCVQKLDAMHQRHQKLLERQQLDLGDHERAALEEQAAAHEAAMAEENQRQRAIFQRMEDEHQQRTAAASAAHEAVMRTQALQHEQIAQQQARDGERVRRTAPSLRSAAPLERPSLCAEPPSKRSRSDIALQPNSAVRAAGARGASGADRGAAPAADPRHRGRRRARGGAYP